MAARSVLLLAAAAMAQLLCLISTANAGIPINGLLLQPPTKPVTQGLHPNITRAFTGLNCSSKAAFVLEKLITVDSKDVCSDFGLDKPSGFKCTALNVIDDFTQRVSSECTPHEQVPVKSTALDGTPIPQPLPDRRPLPPRSWSAAEVEALMKEEAATHYWHITNIINLFLWAPCHPIGAVNATDWLVPEGWTLVKMLSVTPRTPDGANSTRLPAVAIIKSADGTQLDVIVRGTRTALEWKVDLSYEQTENPNYPGMISEGFGAGADYLWAGLEEALREEVVKGNTVKHVTVSGHSLGAAIGGLLAYRTQEYLDRELKAAKKEPITVGALLFAMPNVGNNQFVAAFNQKINARRISYANDVIPQVPCAPHMMACANPDDPSHSPKVTSYNYERVGGQLSFDAGDITVQPQAWQKLSTINGCKVAPWAVATHVCSYPCYYSQFVDATDHGRCKLWAEDSSVPTNDGMVNSQYCPRYPQRDPVFPFPFPPRSKIVIGRR